MAKLYKRKCMIKLREINGKFQTITLCMEIDFWQSNLMPWWPMDDDGPLSFQVHKASHETCVKLPRSTYWGTVPLKVDLKPNRL